MGTGSVPALEKNASLASDTVASGTFFANAVTQSSISRDLQARPPDTRKDQSGPEMAR